MFPSFRKITVAALVFLLIMPVLAFAQTRIGLSLPLSGATEKLARQYEFGARLALEFHNIDSQQRAELIVVDDRCDEKITALAADELLATRPDIVTGILCNVVAFELAERLKGAAIPILVAGAQSETLMKDRSKHQWNVWRLSPGDNEAAQIAVRYLSTVWKNKPFAIVDDGTVYGRNLADAFRVGMEEKNLPPQFQDNFRPTQSTQARLVRRLNRAGVTHVFIGASAEDVAMVARNSEELGIALEFASGEALSIFPFVDPLFLPNGSTTAILKKAETNPVIPARIRARLEQDGLQPEPYILQGYQAMEVALQAVRSTRNATFYELKTREFETLLGSVSFDKHGVNRHPHYAPYLWQNGAFHPVDR